MSTELESDGATVVNLGLLEPMVSRYGRDGHDETETH